MSTAWFRFHGRLNDFLPRGQKEREIPVVFKGRQSIKHLAESLGVPHPEMGPIQVNGQEDAMERIARDDDRVEIRPIANGCQVEPRFLLDCHLGRLAAYLRMLGFDSLYQNDFDDLTMANMLRRDARILLTRDRRLLMRNAVQVGYCLRSLDAVEQLNETVLRFDLGRWLKPFHRCLRCNHALEPVAKEAIWDRLEPLTQQYFDEFQQCAACGQIYWKGSHFERMQTLVEKVARANSKTEN